MKLSPYEIAYITKPLWGKVEAEWINSIAVCLAESGGDTQAMHRSTDTTSMNYGNWDHGLFQISGRWHATKADGTPGILLMEDADWRNPFTNARMAKAVYDGSVKAGKPGWEPWSVWNSLSHEKYLADAKFAIKAPFAPPRLDF